MLTKTLLLAPFLLSLVLEGAAAPSPKRPEIKYPKLKRPGHLAKREALETSVLQNTKRWYSAPKIKAPRTNIWAALSNAEAAAVIGYLHEQSDLNLTASDTAGPWDNQISVVETLPVNKTDAIPYLSAGGEEPTRWARVSIMFGVTEEPYVEDYKVGPLPKPTSYEKLGYTSTKGSSKILNYDADSDALYEYIYSITSGVQDIVQDLCNGTVTGAEDDTLDVWGIDPLWHENSRVMNWLGFWRYDDIGSDGETLLPQGLYFKIDMTGRDPSKWSLIGWLYNDIYYTSTADFRAAWSSPSFEKAGVHNIPSEYIALPGFKEEDSPPLDVRPHPFPIQPAEARFEVDYDAQYVTWMDFSFYIAFGRDRGVRLFDIKYKGERVMYELGLEEAVATYAGNDPVQSGVGLDLPCGNDLGSLYESLSIQTAYLDTYYGFGPYAFALLPAYDCPSYATFLNSTFHVDEQSKTHRNSICLFEFEQDFPTQRHTTSSFVSVTKNVVFQLRSVSTVGNYDYMFTYTFQRDGTIEVSVRASGYIQSAYYLKNDDYGYKIHEALSGSMHDHVLTFKADLDILGTKNTLAKHEVRAVQQECSWSNYTRSTMKLFRSDIATEDDGKLSWHDGAMYIVENKDEKNKYGEYRGWRVKPGLGMGHRLTMTNSSNLFDSQNFATHHLYVTKQSDNEPHCAHANNNYDTRNPIVDFNKFFDGESLEQEDLVLWVNLGMTHVPHTGDLPNTVFNTAQSSVQFLPHNYLLGDPSRSVHHQVKVEYSNEGVQNILQYGENPSGTLDLADTVPKLWSYKGDIAVRKFPFDPANPFEDTDSIV